LSKAVLTIAGSDPSGGAGIQNDLKTIAAHGLHGASCVTVVTIQNSRGLVGRSVMIDPAAVRRQIAAVAGDLPISAAKVGLVGNAAISRAVAQSLKRAAIRPVVVDPIIWAGTGHLLLADDPMEVFAPLMRVATVLTPNVPEAEALSGTKIRNPRQSEEAARRILKLGPKSVVVKGGHLRDEPFTDILVTAENSVAIAGTKIDSRSTHGSGCTFSTSIACNLANGMGLEESVRQAKKFTEAAIRAGRWSGAGNGPVDPLGTTLREAESLRICEELSRVVAELEATPGFYRLVPQVGINIAMAPSTACAVEDVIGLSGRIIRIGERARACGWPCRGGSAHMARMALALRQLTGNLGCCMNIKYAEPILAACNELGLSVAKFERELEPEGEKTMAWAVRHVLRSLPRPPDLLYDLGSVGKEPMMRILGSTPTEVARKAQMIAGALR